MPVGSVCTINIYVYIIKYETGLLFVFVVVVNVFSHTSYPNLRANVLVNSAYMVSTYVHMYINIYT